MSQMQNPDVLLTMNVLRFLRTKPFGVDLVEMADLFGQTPEQMRAIIDYLWTVEVLDTDGSAAPERLLDFDAEGLELADPWVKLTHDPLGEIPLSLPPQELATVQLGLQALAGAASGAQREQIIRLAEKIRQGSGNAVTVDEDQHFAVMQDAVVQQRQLILTYQSESAQAPVERTVDPLRIEILDGMAYLNAFCHSANALRWFRADRISNVSVGDRVRDAYSEEAIHRTLTVTGRKLPRVTCRVNAAGLTLLQPYLRPRKRIPVVQGDATAEVTFPVRSFDVLASLVARSAGGIVVLEPAAAREHVIAWCSAAIDSYAVD